MSECCSITEGRLSLWFILIEHSEESCCTHRVLEADLRDRKVVGTLGSEPLRCLHEQARFSIRQ